VLLCIKHCNSTTTGAGADVQAANVRGNEKIMSNSGSTIIEEIDRLKGELDKLRPLPADVVGRIEQKLRLESNYHSNAIEGNSLTLGETRSLILHGLTAHGKPMRDHLDIEGHNEAVKAIEDTVKRNEDLNEVFIRNLHKVLLKEPYENDAITPEGQPTKRLISIGDYKTQPNNVRTSTGEIYYYTPPEQVKPAMSDLIDWYRRNEKEGEHPIIIASAFHYCFVRIHPFDDGNGRMARLLMNMILIKHGYTVAIIPREERDQYIQTLEQADKSEDLAEFITYIAHCCEYALNLHLKAARGEDIEDVEDIDKEIAIFKRSLQRSKDDTIEARMYADQVLYPFYLYCEDRIEQFSEVFGRIQYNVDSQLSYTGGVHLKKTLNATSSVRDAEDKISIFPLSKENDIWPEHARSISTILTSSLLTFQGRQDEGFLLEIESGADSNDCIWKFSGTHTRTRFSIYERCTGRDLEELKKTFNEVLRSMMRMLSENLTNQVEQ
jgi:Fic family protein